MPSDPPVRRAKPPKSAVQWRVVPYVEIAYLERALDALSENNWSIVQILGGPQGSVAIVANRSDRSGRASLTRSRKGTPMSPSDAGWRQRDFECFFNFQGWWAWSLGVHLDLWHPHLDVHVPFGFARIGWNRAGAEHRPRPRSFGWNMTWAAQRARYLRMKDGE